MESSFMHTVFLKHMFLPIGLILIGIGLRDYLYENSIIINGEPSKLDEFGLLIFICLGLLFMILWNYLRHRIIRVRLGGQNITIIEKEEIIIPWLQVVSLKRIPFFSPPIYKIKYEKDGLTYLFLTKPFYIDFGLGVHDASDMGALIRKKRKELNL